MRTTGPLLLSTVGANRVAYVADEDPPSVRAFDVAGRRELWATPLEGTPGHLAAHADGRLFVAVRAHDRVDVIATNGSIGAPTAATVFVPKVCTEPVGMSLSPDESTLVVACGWAHELVAISVQDARVVWRVDLPLEPRAVMVTQDGKQAVVSHAVGARLSVVDMQTHAPMVMELRGSLVGRPRLAAPTGVAFGMTLTGAAMMTSNGFALAEYDGTVYAPAISSLTDRGPNVTTVYYGSDVDEGVVFPIATREPPKSKWLYGKIPAPGFASVGSFSSTAAASQIIRGCLAPRGIAIRPIGAPAEGHPNKPSTRLVACPGNDLIIEHDETGEAIRKIPVAGGPSAIVVDSNDTAIVWSQFSRELSTIDLRRTNGGVTGGIAAVDRTTVAPIQIRLGKRIFERVNDSRISRAGRACASCHPDGRADALTWGTPEGPRQTMMLAGRLAGTAPYGWTRGSRTVHGYVSETISRLGGKGLPPSEMEALIAYVSSLRVPDAATFAAPVTSIGIKKGKSIFESREAACSTCHSGPQLTDGMSHSVTVDELPPTGSSAKSDRVLFDTPSLRFIGHTAPYFHDGRYATLKHLLVDVDGKMGHTKHLSPNDLDALESYLHTL